jgi:hypothetical protein
MNHDVAETRKPAPFEDKGATLLPAPRVCMVDGDDSSASLF